LCLFLEKPVSKFIAFFNSIGREFSAFFATWRMSNPASRIGQQQPPRSHLLAFAAGTLQTLAQVFENRYKVPNW